MHSYVPLANDSHTFRVMSAGAVPAVSSAHGAMKYVVKVCMLGPGVIVARVLFKMPVALLAAVGVGVGVKSLYPNSVEKVTS